MLWHGLEVQARAMVCMLQATSCCTKALQAGANCLCAWSSACLVQRKWLPAGWFLRCS